MYKVGAEGLTQDTPSHIRVPGFQCLLLHTLGSQQVRAQVLGTLSPTWGTPVAFLAPGISLAQSWLLSSRECTDRWKTSLFFS